MPAHLIRTSMLRIRSQQKLAPLETLLHRFQGSELAVNVPIHCAPRAPVVFDWRDKMKMAPKNMNLLVCTLFSMALLSLVPVHAGERGLAYISSQDGGVNVLDLERMEITQTIDVGAKGPRGIGLTTDGKFLVVANKDGGNLSIIERSSGKLIKQVKIGKNPEFVRVMGDKAFVTYEPSSKGGPPPKPGEAVTKVEDDDDDNIPARIAIVDLKRGKVLREVVSGPETEGIEFSADGKQMIVTNEADHTITVHSLKTGKLLKTMPTSKFGDRPRGIKISPDGKTYVATLEFGNKVLVMNERFEAVTTFATGKTPYGISFDRSGQRIFVAASREKMLQVFDAKSFEKIKDIPTGDRCWHFTFTPDNQQILLACGKSDEIVVIDANKLEVTQRIANKGMPWGIVTYPKAFGSLDQP